MSIKKICILGLDDYAMLTGNTAFGLTGGESVQHVLLAKAWRDLGLDVSIIVRDHGQPRITTIDGIRAVAAYPHKGGIYGLRFLHPRLTGIWRAMRHVDADIYYQSPASPWAGLAAFFAKTSTSNSFCASHRIATVVAGSSRCRTDVIVGCSTTAY